MALRTHMCLATRPTPANHKGICKTVQQCTFLLIVCCFLMTCAEQSFVNEWAVEINGGEDVANDVALTHGFINHGKILQNTNFYWFSHPRLRKRSLESNVEHHTRLISHENVLWAEQQVAKVRRKRDMVHFNGDEGPNDPRWSVMWYLLPSKQPSMHVVDAWQEGYSGKGVSVTILDDGIEYTHPDLAKNYDPEASSDINDHDDDPAPRLNPSNENRHGTRCAGEVAAVADNNICSVGVAYNANIGGVRMLDGPVTDVVESKSIGLNPDHVDIYSASWGPDDDGRTVDGPGPLAKQAFREGVRVGRHGKGSIFVWASGNGGKHADNCNCDGYTNSIHTLSISSTTSRMQKPWYSESCSSTLASTYSSGSIGEPQIVTTDLRHGCTNGHTGTSASAPLAAAICALALEANGNLTWRDMQHLVVRTAQSEGLVVDDWVTNGVGRKVSHAFGYGLMDALAMVRQAKTWSQVPPQRNCTITVISTEQTPRVFSSKVLMQVPVLATACTDGSPMIERLEHVQAQLTLRNQRRGDLSIYLLSPSGTRSKLLGKRRDDMSRRGFDKWPFMTTHSWDEDPRGKWILEVHDDAPRDYTGTLSGFDLVFYGTLLSDWSESEVHPGDINPPKPSESVVTETQHPAALSTTATMQQFKPVSTVPSTSANCKRLQTTSTGCLVCKSGSVRMPDHTCGLQCPAGHYAALEKPDQTGEKTIEVNSSGSEPKDINDGLVCRQCAPFCHSCAGKLPRDCVQCVAGARMVGGTSVCVMPEKPTVQPDPARRYYTILVLAVLALVIMTFTLVYVLRQQRRQSCFGGSEQQYKYVPTGDGAISRFYSDSGLDPYHDEDTQYSDRPVGNGYLPKPANGYANGAYVPEDTLQLHDDRAM